MGEFSEHFHTLDVTVSLPELDRPEAHRSAIPYELGCIKIADRNINLLSVQIANLACALLLVNSYPTFSLNFKNALIILGLGAQRASPLRSPIYGRDSVCRLSTRFAFCKPSLLRPTDYRLLT